jgi:hypothetical protein
VSSSHGVGPWTPPGEEASGPFPRWRRSLPWTLAVVAVAVVAASLGVEASNEARGFAAGMPAGALVVPFALAVGFTVVGGSIVRRDPRHGLGWMLAWFGIALSVGVFVDEYAYHVPALPGREWVALWSNAGFLLFVVPLVSLTPLLFPDGRLPSPRWRLPVGAAGAGLAVVFAVRVLDPRPHDLGLVSPVGVPAVEPWVAPLTVAGLVPIVALTVAGLVNTVVRHRRAAGVERQQMKWFAAGAAITVSGGAALGVLYGLFGAVELAILVFATSALALPIAIGVAILRYRLYDIDRVVSRTVSYALVTVILVGVYTAGVLGFGVVVRAASGGAGGDLVVAASTLGVAAAFQPLRRRVQLLVDRRFNRARYDARRTVEEFAHRLRDEVDLDLIAAGVRETARGTMQPTQVSLWFPEGRP